VITKGENSEEKRGGRTGAKDARGMGVITPSQGEGRDVRSSSKTNRWSEGRWGEACGNLQLAEKQ